MGSSLGFCPLFCGKLSNRLATVATMASGRKSNNGLGLKKLMESLSVDIHRAEGRKLNVPLMAPFTIATSRLEGVENVAIRVELSNGCCGWGESPILPFVTSEDQTTALNKASEACHFLINSRPMSLGHVLTGIAQLLPGHHFASVRAGVEMAVIDAVATSIGTPLWRFFGGVSNTITTDITIPIVSPTEASQLASKYNKQGFKTLKLKVGKDLNADIEVLKAIRVAHPHCLFILDANEGYISSEAIQVLEKLHDISTWIRRFCYPKIQYLKAMKFWVLLTSLQMLEAMAVSFTGTISHGQPNPIRPVSTCNKILNNYPNSYQFHLLKEGNKQINDLSTIWGSFLTGQTSLVDNLSSKSHIWFSCRGGEVCGSGD